MHLAEPRQGQINGAAALAQYVALGFNVVGTGLMLQRTDPSAANEASERLMRVHLLGGHLRAYNIASTHFDVTFDASVTYGDYG